MYFYLISGVIPGNKSLEFEQTFRIVKSRLSNHCTGCSCSRDLEEENKYHFISYWDRLDSMESFTHSAYSKMLLGAFQTLGKLSQSMSGIMIEIEK